MRYVQITKTCGSFEYEKRFALDSKLNNPIKEMKRNNFEFNFSTSFLEL